MTLDTFGKKSWDTLKPIEIIQSFSKEKTQLQREVVTNQPLIKNFVDYITKNYWEDDLKDITGWTDLNNYISSQVLWVWIEDGIKHVWWLMPWVNDLFSAYKEGKKMLDEVSTMFWWSSLQSLIDEYITLWKDKPFDVKKIEKWMTEHDMTHKQEVKQEKEEKTDQSNTETINHSTANEIVSDTPNLEKIIELAKSEVGTNEKDNTADKYFRELWYKYDSKKVPWCWAFVSWTLMKAGFPIPKNDLSAKAFINEWWLWHVWIKVDWKVVSWNYWNKVATDDINKPIQWYAIPTASWLEIHKEKVKFDDIPEGAVVVFDRSSKRKQAA